MDCLMAVGELLNSSLDLREKVELKSEVIFEAFACGRVAHKQPGSPVHHFL